MDSIMTYLVAFIRDLMRLAAGRQMNIAPLTQGTTWQLVRRFAIREMIRQAPMHYPSTFTPLYLAQLIMATGAPASRLDPEDLLNSSAGGFLKEDADFLNQNREWIMADDGPSEYAVWDRPTTRPPGFYGDNRAAYGQELPHGGFRRSEMPVFGGFSRPLTRPRDYPSHMAMPGYPGGNRVWPGFWDGPQSGAASSEELDALIGRQHRDEPDLKEVRERLFSLEGMMDILLRTTLAPEKMEQVRRERYAPTAVYGTMSGESETYVIDKVTAAIDDLEEQAKKDDYAQTSTVPFRAHFVAEQNWPDIWSGLDSMLEKAHDGLPKESVGFFTLAAGDRKGKGMIFWRGESGSEELVTVFTYDGFYNDMSPYPMVFIKRYMAASGASLGDFGPNADILQHVIDHFPKK